MQSILTVNGGSSSIRFAVYQTGATLQRRLSGKIDRIGARGTTLIVDDPAARRQAPRRVAGANHRMAVAFLLDWLEEQGYESTSPFVILTSSGGELGL